MNNVRRKNLEKAADLIAEAREIIDQAKEEEEEAFENLPEGIQGSDRGEAMEECIFDLEEIIGVLEDLEGQIGEINDLLGGNMNKIFVWIKRPGETPKHVWVSDSLENLQKNVGGYIETVTITNNVVIICNEEGRLLKLQPNCEICGIPFVGTIIIAGVKKDEFTDCPMDTKTMKRLFPQLWEVKQ